MSLTIDQTLRSLNDCGCCEGITTQTPVEITNLPGLKAIAYRSGTYMQFKQSMLARLSAPDLPALHNLTTRDNDDFTIALLDAWAMVADVLTFYQERIASESYLRTATERVSILHLARLIGYELRPGVATSTYLAFTLEDAPGAPHKATIDTGIKVQSVPGQGEQPQIFETIEKIEARAEWNAIKPKLTKRHPIKGGMDQFFFEGITTGLKPGDGLLIIPDDGSKSVFRQVEKVTLQPEQQRTLVQLQPLLSNTKGSITIAPPSRKMLNPDSIAINQFDRISFDRIVSSANINAEAFIQNFIVEELFDHIQAIQPPSPTVFTFRMRASIFGHNAPSWNSLPNNQRYGEFGWESERKYGFIKGPYFGKENSWADNINLGNYPPDGNKANLYLDNVYPGIVKNSFVVLRDNANCKLYKVKETSELSKSDFALTAKVSRLTLCAPFDILCEKTPGGLDLFKIRTTTVCAQSEELQLSRMPCDEPVSGRQIELNGLVDGSLSAGQTIIICGELYQNRGMHRCEAATISYIEEVLENDSFTRITLTTKLENDYVRDTVTINANVARATHGETVEEVLGSGDASQPYQQFTLRQPPLTYVSTPTPSGAESTLKVRVNDLLWHEVPTLYGCGSGDRVFVTRTGDDGKTTVQFGDGKMGMRLTTGQENVRANYRRGVGLTGNVDAGQLSMLMTRPLGVKSVANPLSANGGADRESLDEARQNARLTVLTLDRIVSLQDFEDFTRAFAGIAKALATWTWSGQKRGVFVTVAGPKGAKIDSGSNPYKNLLSAMQKAGDPYIPVRVESYRRALFRIAARVKVNPDYRSEKVLSAVEKSLRLHFSFDARNFGQPVALSEVMAVIQAVPGVEAVDVDKLYRYGQEAKLNSILAAATPQVGANATVSAAELLTLDPAPFDDLGVMQ